MEVNLESLIKDLAIRAGSFVRSKANDMSYRQIMRRGLTDVSRRIDLEVEDIIIKGIEEEGLRAVINTEERGVVRVGDGEPEYVFIIDPLDGSLNFVLDIPFYSISIAVGKYGNSLRFSDLTDGVVYYVTKDVLYYGGPRGVEFRGDDLGDLSEDIDRPVISLYLEPDADERLLRGLRAIYDRFGRFKIRSLGAASLEMVMASIGRFLAFMDLRNRLRIFDVAGAYVISRAMKVDVYTLNGGKLGNELVSSDRRFSLVVSRNGDFIRSFLDLLRVK
ncbi:inositol monophosphatase family protein [Vulcanisaeta distributa]|uniref:Inositol monophosphatase n=1 Tax=Vulcanisaeta distributa (strain DSM 14429 / JCM 11212 / NBRC 100878 / IC-017) TaxID=572478 RepID=E1QT63_VULDI|nr:inositol monophosphatase family protein [Vulcanisaeta distributa]ADN49655.1 inositol monophosphatase [Vulcanisaeta distributa DSM 14429]